jgi:hypothetical protein
MDCTDEQQRGPRHPAYFLVGPERAGTTMFRLMLQRHPCIAWNSESDYFVDAVTDDGRWPGLEAYYAMLAHDPTYDNDRIFAGHRFVIDRSLDYPSLVRSFLEQARRRDGDRPVVGATVHRHFDRLVHIWPDARFIKLTRDGRDVAASGKAMGWYGNLWSACDRWLDAETCWERLRGKLSPDRWLEVRYEELVARPVDVLTGVCAFMGLPYDAGMLSYDATSGYEYPDPKCANQWKRRLSPGEVRLIESRTAEMLARRGYEPSGHPPMRVGPLRRRWLAMTNRLGRSRHRLRQFGLPLVAGSFLARRLRLHGVERRLRARMNAIMDAGVKR